jgi:AcrR family transcriptional regulator
LERRRPRVDGLTIERVVDEALALVDSEGLDALTVRGLAARFDTSSATLYRHVASRTRSSSC